MSFGIQNIDYITIFFLPNYFKQIQIIKFEKMKKRKRKKVTSLSLDLDPYAFARNILMNHKEKIKSRWCKNSRPGCRHLNLICRFPKACHLPSTKYQKPLIHGERVGCQWRCHHCYRDQVWC